MTILTLNSSLNGIEVKFSEKPGDAVLTELKSSGFRWHKKKQIWYAKQTPERLELAEKLVDREATLANTAQEAEENEEKPGELAIHDVLHIDDGLYSGWKGVKNGTWHSDKELKALLLADFKRAGISATVRFKRGGYLTRLTVTLKIKASDILPFEVWREDCMHEVFGGGLPTIDITAESGGVSCALKEDVLSATGADGEKLRLNACRTYYERLVDRMASGTEWHHGEPSILTEDARKRFSTARAIVASYNRDQSCSASDFFDRDIYDYYAFKIA